MEPLSNESRLTARTAPEIVARVKILVIALQRAGVKYRGRKIGIEGVVGAVLQEFLSKGLEEQHAIISRRIPEIERMLEEASAPDVSKPETESATPRPAPAPIRWKPSFYVPDPPPPPGRDTPEG